MLAHVVPAPGSHEVLLWPAMALVGAGVLGALFAGRGWRRRAAVALLAAGVCSAAAIYATEPSRPPAPGYAISLRVSTPGPVRSPLHLRLCGTTGSGSAAVVPGSDRLVEIWVDGQTVAEGPYPAFAIPLAAGDHDVAAEVVAANHLEYTPPLRTPAERVTVSATGLPSAPQTSC